MSGAPASAAARTAQAAMLVALCATALAFLPLHDGAWWPGHPMAGRAAAAAVVALAWLLASAGVVVRARRAARARAAAAATGSDLPGRDDWLVVHASQTGQAAEIAQRTSSSLQGAGLQAWTRDIALLDGATLAAARQVLFIASTTGEGDAPDAAAGFIAACMRDDADLPGLRYAVLALGDRGYRNYCAFGHVLDQWLRQAGASPMFDLVEVDNGDPAALRHWQHQLGSAAGAPALPDWTPVAHEPWTLARRRVLNPGSEGGPVFELELVPPDGVACDWRAGDIAEVVPRQAPATVAALLTAAGVDAAAPVRVGDTVGSLDEQLSRSLLPAVDAIQGLDPQAVAERLRPLPSREYSIASIAGEGRLRLLLRRMLHPDGTPGTASGWLCEHVQPGDHVDLRIRANPGFQGLAVATPMVLVGNGTGLAGLRAHLADRAATGHARSWLLFGERHGDRDFHLRDDILEWLANGGLERLDLAFSRGTGGTGVPCDALSSGRATVHCGYVQDALRAEAARLRDWIDAGAAILVCGSLRGMAAGVDGALRAILGDARVDGLLASGRYRRDVY